MLKTNQTAPNFTYNTCFDKGLDFYSKLGEKNILIFSRYIGCSLCQLKLLETKSGFENFSRFGAKVFFVLQSTEENAKPMIEKMEIPFEVILDPECKLYEIYDIAAAKSKLGLVSPKVLKLISQSKKEGLVHGEYEGNELQLPAIFILDKSAKIKYSKYAKNLGDLPDNEEILALIK